jgi:hypothetical protein
MDNLVYEETINTEISSSEFVDKQWLYVNDNNNSSYSGQIVIDTTSLSNCGQYLNWSESFLTIPLVLQLQSEAGGSLPVAEPCDFMVGLKSGYWQIIHSLIVEFNNSNVVQQVPYLNVFNSFKANTSWSCGDVENWGALTGYCPDSADSWVYNTFGFGGAAGTAAILNSFGSGICNNSNAPYVQITNYGQAWIPSVAVTAAPATTATAAEAFNVASYNETTQATTWSSGVRSSTYNKGFYRRQQWLNFSPQPNAGGLNDFESNQSALITTAQMSAIFRSYTQSIPQQRAYVFDAIIRMKDICDMFAKMPMVKGGTMRLYINTNQCYFTARYTSGVYTVDEADETEVAIYGDQILYNQVALTSSPIILGGGGTNPIMLASSDVGQGGFQATGITSSVTGVSGLNVAVGLSIVRTQFPQLINGISQAISAPITSCRLYCPAYTMSPLAEQRLLSLCPTKKVVYNDIFYYTFNDVAAGQTFSFLVSNGIPNLRGCLVVPTLRQNANGTAANGSVVCDSILSPFSSSPATPDPISLTNFNIQVSGKNLFITNLLYDYEVFAEQLVSSNQLNGSLTTSLASGQIGFSEFEKLYRYYYGNISRSIPSEDGVAKAIQIVGQNASTQTISFQVFLEFERQMTIDLRTGARIE